MKKAAFLFTVLFALCGFAAAQQIKTSPFEGRWVWDKRGDSPEYGELYFFGNIMFGFDEDYPDEYDGESFTFTSRVLIFGDDDFRWQYSLLGNSLTITEFDDTYTYRKANMTKSPIQGIWKIKSGANSELDFDTDTLLVFFGDIMGAGNNDYGYEGIKTTFRGKTFVIDFVVMEYRLSGNTLTLISGGNEIVLTKIY